MPGKLTKMCSILYTTCGREMVQGHQEAITQWDKVIPTEANQAMLQKGNAGYLQGTHMVALGLITIASWVLRI